MLTIKSPQIRTAPILIPITYEGITTIDAAATFPGGYTLDGMGAEIYRGHTEMVECGSDYTGSGYTAITPTTGTLSYLTPLKFSGDKYGVWVDLDSSASANDMFSKCFFGQSAGSHTFDLSHESLLTDRFLKVWNNGQTITGLPTFEWNAWSGAGFYELYLFDFTSFDFEWVALTTGDHATMPVYLYNNLAGGGDEYVIRLSGVKGVNYPPIYLQNAIPSDAYIESAFSSDLSSYWTSEATSVHFGVKKLNSLSTLSKLERHNRRVALMKAGGPFGIVNPKMLRKEMMKLNKRQGIR